MTKEEKKAIEEIKKALRLAKNIDDITTTIRNEYAEIIVGLIDKQQKEIEKYKNVIFNLNNNWISKEELKNILEKLKDKEQEMSDEQGYWGGSELQAKIEILEELLEE